MHALAFFVPSLGTLAGLLCAALGVLLCWFAAVCLEQSDIGNDIDDEK